MQESKVYLYSQNYCAKAKTIKFFVEVEDADELMAFTPVALYNNTGLYAALSSEERERVAYLAGYQSAQEIMATLGQLQKQVNKVAKPAAKKLQTKKKSAKKL